MSNTSEGSASQRAPVTSTFEFNYDRQNETDIKKTVPKLKGEANWATWNHRLYMALNENNKAYIRIIHE